MMGRRHKRRSYSRRLHVRTRRKAYTRPRPIVRTKRGIEEGVLIALRHHPVSSGTIAGATLSEAMYGSAAPGAVLGGLIGSAYLRRKKKKNG